MNFVVQALGEPSLCFHAANALRDLCDVNRTALAGHISAFGELHARVPSFPVSLLSRREINILNSVQVQEAMKVIQSIASVIQALPVEQQVQPIEVCVLQRPIRLTSQGSQ